MKETQPHASRPDTTIIDRTDILTGDLPKVRVLSLMVESVKGLRPDFFNQGISWTENIACFDIETYTVLLRLYNLII